MKFTGNALRDCDAFDLYKLYEDLFLLKEQRKNMFLEGIQNEDLFKVRSNAGKKKPQALTRKRN